MGETENLEKKIVECREPVRHFANRDLNGIYCPLSQRTGVSNVECPYVKQKEGSDMLYCGNKFSEDLEVTLYGSFKK